jgi:sugar fermentation stimulation protein A
MQFHPPLLPGTLVRRYKRFFADVLLDSGQEVVSHCVNPGSMLGCFNPGWRCWVTPRTEPHLKLKYTLELIKVPDALVGVNTALPNALVEEALRGNQVPAVPVRGELRREFRWNEATRFDFQLTGDGPETLLEVKNVTLAEGGTGYFPDSVSTRALKHLDELALAKESGRRAVLLFWVNRSDCLRVRPAEWIDPDYARGLRRAAVAGVEILGVAAKVSTTGIVAGTPVAVDLSPMDSWGDPPLASMAAVAAKAAAKKKVRSLESGVRS